MIAGRSGRCLVAVALLTAGLALSACSGASAGSPGSTGPTDPMRATGSAPAASTPAPARSSTATHRAERTVTHATATPLPHLVSGHASSFAGLPFVGPLFPKGTSHSHGCVATVVPSRTGDTILTAAHCLHADERGIQFAPGYRGGATPYGVWTIVNAQADSTWLRTHDHQHDMAAFTVADIRWHGALRTLQQVVGAAQLGTAPRKGSVVSMVGYNRGTGDYAVRCAAAVTYTSGFPTISCGGFGSGTSGAPWLTNRGAEYTLVGLIGGIHNGGCTADVSYSPAFGTQVRGVVALASAGRPSVRGTGAGPDDC